MVTTIKCRIEGLAPLLQHRFPEEEEDLKAKRKTGRVDYSQEVEKALYRDENGVIYEPSSHIEGALRKAAANFQIPGKGKKTYKNLILSSVIVEPEKIPLNPQTYTVDRRSVVVNRARVYRYRPRFENWSLEFTIKILDDQLSPDVLQEILEYAGAACGIGDYRPKFGRFKVTQFEVIEDA